MKAETKGAWTMIGWSLAGLIGLAPVCLWLLAWRAFQPYRIKKQREAENVVQRFHEGYSSGQIDKVCEAVYGCSLSASAKEDWHCYIEKVREAAGSLKTVTSSRIEVHIEPPGVRATYVSIFEKGEGTEVFDLGDYVEPLKRGIATLGTLRIDAYHMSIGGELVFPSGERRKRGRAGLRLGRILGWVGLLFCGGAVTPTVRYLRILSRRFSPSPRIASKSSTLLNGPYDLRICRIFCAVAGPSPGTC